MNTPGNWIPTLSPTDIHKIRTPGSRALWTHAQTTGTHPSGYHIRFTLPITSSYPEDLTFTAEVFNPETLSWNTLWSIPGSAYRFITAANPEDDAAETDPTTNVIAHALAVPSTQAASWQKIINTLAAKVDHTMTTVPPRRP